MPESEPRLIRGYLEVLAAQLPGPIVEELADGLTETHRSYLSRGLTGNNHPPESSSQPPSAAWLRGLRVTCLNYDG